MQPSIPIRLNTNPTRHRSVKGRRERRCHSQSRRSSSHSGRPSYANWTSSSNFGVLLDQEVATAFSCQCSTRASQHGLQAITFLHQFDAKSGMEHGSVPDHPAERAHWRYVEMPWALRHHERIPESSHRTGLLGSLFDAEELPSWNDNCQFLHGFHAFAGTIPTGKRELKCV